MAFAREPEYAVPGPVRLTLPISVAYDLDKFEKALANAEHIIAGPRDSRGAKPPLQAREFVVDPASLQVMEAPPSVRIL